MERCIGLDAHASSRTLGVVGPSGKRLGSDVVETNARALIEVLRGIPRNRHVCLKEGTLSGWRWEVLEPHVEELVVTGVHKSRGPRSDKQDAFALAEQLRIGSLETVVYKDRGRFGGRYPRNGSPWARLWEPVPGVGGRRRGPRAASQESTELRVRPCAPNAMVEPGSPAPPSLSAP